jgi:hypothetical protein
MMQKAKTPESDDLEPEVANVAEACERFAANRGVLRQMTERIAVALEANSRARTSKGKQK